MIRTITYSIDITNSDCEIIKQFQKDYSQSFRKLYNNMDLMLDDDFNSLLKIKSKKQLEYLRKEVIAFNDRNTSNKEKIKDNINDLLEIKKLNNKQFKRLISLQKSLKNKVVFGNKNELTKLSKNNGDRYKWKESRLLPLIYYGETSRKGNRFFDFSKMDEGIIIFKPENTKIKIPIKLNRFNKYKEIKKLTNLAINKEIPITVKLTYNKILLSYDVSILNGTNVDIKKFYKEISYIKDKEKRKFLISNHYKEHENNLKKGKLDRYIGLDLNPDGIGYSIVDKNMNIINKGYYDLSKIYDTNKRKYESSIVIKDIFKLIKHYKIHTFILEELDLKIKDNGNKVSNRKINNLWNRTYIKELIEKRCAETGTILTYINPVYTSFIGNIIHNEYDPIAASLEVVRRGIYKYSKGGFYPELNITSFINDEKYDKIKECSTWKDMYSLFITSKWSYRRKLKKFNFLAKNISSNKSKVLLYKFQ